MTIKIHDLKPAPGAKRDARRVGRGIGGKGGKTAGRGHKGTGARGTVKPGFEGGQTPLHRRIPKAKGFRNPFRVEYHVVNLDTLSGFAAGDVVDQDALHARGLAPKSGKGLVKVLGRGEISVALTVKVHAFSTSARNAITAAGGTCEVVPAPWGDRRPPAGSNNALTNR